VWCKSQLANPSQWLSFVAVTEPVTVPLHAAADLPARRELAIMLTGGGARAAYQVGLLRGLAHHFPNLTFPIITGVSAGAINAIFLASKEGPLHERVQQLAEMWRELQCYHIFRPNWAALLPFRGMLNTILPSAWTRRPHGFFNAGPLAELLRRAFDTPHRNEPIEGIRRNLMRDVNAVALMTLDYTTGQSVRWVQGSTIREFEGANQRSVQTELTVEHVLASAALPFVFPAVRVQNRWHGDGGIRLSAPLSPAVHLGATHILAMSTGYQRTGEEANTPVVHGYPPAAQILGQLLNAIFLDVIDEDVLRMDRMNELLCKLDEEERDGFKPIELFVLRPSVDLGKLAGAYEKYLPPLMKLFTRALGSHETESSDFVSLLMFEPHYVQRLLEIGEHDVEMRLDDLREFVGEAAGARVQAV
jgi:NTE family protein